MYNNRHERGVKMKDKIKRAFNDRKYYINRNCALENMVRDNSGNTCKDCKYNYIGKCMIVGLMVLK